AHDVDERERRERDRLHGERAREGGQELPEDEVARQRRRDREALERVAVALEGERRRGRDGDEERERREDGARRESHGAPRVAPRPRRVDHERRDRDERDEEDRGADGSLPGARPLPEDEEVLPGDRERPLEGA